jgi:long-chain acyl-CoA synthetase
MGINAAQILRQAALRWPDRPAVIDAGAAGSARRVVTYRDLDERARSVATRLARRGVQHGYRVALIADNSEAFVAAWFGILYAGATVVPIPVVSAAPEVAHRLRHARCRAVLFDGDRTALVNEVLAGLDFQIARFEVAHVTQVASDAIPHPGDAAPHEPAMALYTSGTSGEARCALISHASLLLHTSVIVHHAIALRADDCVLGALPLTHSFGCRMVMLATFFAGARCVLVPRFDAARTLTLMQQEEVTWLPAVPTMYAAWGDQGGGARSSKLRWGLSAGAPLPDEVARRAELRLGAEIRQGYGLTEATFSTMNAPPDPRVLGSVGRPVWGVEVRIVDAGGADVPAGADGEVLVRGHNAMNGYLDDPDATRLVSGTGWIRTGDVGRFDEHGRLAIVDRIKDLIIRGGNNVYPAEVEAVLAEHPEIAEVAVIGRPDRYWGEEVVAVIVAREGTVPDPDQINVWVRERIASTKVPREYAFVPTLPLGPSGKVLKRELIDWMVQGMLVPVGLRSARLRSTPAER